MIEQAEATFDRPDVLPVRPEGIPGVLKKYDQWVCHRLEKQHGRWTKVPYSPTDHKRASISDPSTWGGFDEAWTAYTGGGYHALAFALTDDDPFTAVDLDHCINEQGTTATWAGEIIEAVQSYTERSPSGTGIRIVCEADLPDRHRKSGDVEMYDSDRFVSITGQHIESTPATVEDRQQQVWRIHADVFADRIAKEQERQQRAAQAPAGPVDATDEAIINKLRSGRQREKFEALWSGNTDGYPSHSEADQALCNQLAFYCGGDESRIDRLFRASGLMRAKWAERDDYRERTLANAIDSCGDFYDWSRAQRNGRQNGSTHPRSIGQTQGGGKLPPPERPERVENATIIETEEDGQKQRETVPRSINDIIGDVYAITDGWPRRLDRALFVDEPHRGPEHRLSWLESPAALFGYVGGKSAAPARFHKTPGTHSKQEVFAEIQRTAKPYRAVETMPHEPIIDGHYYACDWPEPGDGSALRELVDRFTPETDIDRDLILSMFATVVWGGRGGSRPAFLITADDGRGSGKSALASMLAHFAGGAVELSSNEDAGVIKQRLLSPDGITRRVAQLDNVKSNRFSWSELESLITSPVISGKRLYVGEATRPNNLVWTITLNGASLSTDLAQRCCIIKVRRPSYVGDWAEQTRDFIDRNRQAIIGDCIAFLRADRYPLPRFTRWGSWEQDILARLPHPEEGQAVIGERQAASDVEQDEAGLIEEHFAHRLATAGYTDRDRVFLPSRIVSQWLHEATGEKHSTTAATRRTKQKINEGAFRQIEICPTRSYGRGFIWAGKLSAPDDSLSTDLETRIQRRDNMGNMYADGQQSL